MRQDAGFSLVETMVAVLLFAAVSIAGVSILVAYQNGQTDLLKADGFSADIQRAHSFIKADLENALLRPARNQFGDTLPLFRSYADPDTGPLIGIIRGGHMGALVSEASPAILAVEYRLENGVFLRRSYARPDRTVETPYVDQPLLKNIRSVNLRYRYQAEWSTEWSLRNVNQDLMPELLEMELVFEEKGALKGVYVVGRAAS